jgi:hypothetical protein
MEKSPEKRKTKGEPGVVKKRRPRELLNLGISMSSAHQQDNKKLVQKNRTQIGPSEQTKQPSFNKFLIQQKDKKLMKFHHKYFLSISNFIIKHSLFFSQRLFDFDATNIPSEVREMVKESNQYEKLKDFENNLDMLIKKKKIDLEELMIQPVPKIKTSLLLHIYNTHYNQNNHHTLTSPVILILISSV